jgi:hypothetical protein
MGKVKDYAPPGFPGKDYRLAEPMPSKGGQHKLWIEKPIRHKASGGKNTYEW